MANTLGCRGEDPFGRVFTFIPEPFVEQAKTIWMGQTAKNIPGWSEAINGYFEPVE